MRWIAAAVIAALAIAAATIPLTTGQHQPREASPMLQRPPVTDALAVELRRCLGLGEAALHERACLDAWTEHRRRFLGAHPSTGSVR
jgi:conjugative transfer region protein TrbK